MNNDNPESKCSILLGTPNPVAFHEAVIPGSIELDLELRTAARIDVTGYDETKYADAAALEDFIRDRFYALLVQSLKKTDNGSLMKGGNPGKYLASLIKDELVTYGITGEVETIGFALTEDSEKRLKEAMEDAKPYLNGEVDRTDRPYSGFLDQDRFLAAAPETAPAPETASAPETPSEPQDKFCRNCGAKRMPNARFCTECGSVFK